MIVNDDPLLTIVTLYVRTTYAMKFLFFFSFELYVVIFLKNVIVRK